MRVNDPGPDEGSCLTVSLDDEAYPPLLREIHDPPETLYVRGQLPALQRPQFAIVGSRRASAAGIRLAKDLGRALSDAGLCVCSGMALGIDAAAHQGALAGASGTVGVMATGIDRIYPRRHRQLSEEICQQGCLVTEFKPGMPPLKENFPRRNRIVSGMALGVLVVEAALPSGSLITARTALEQGREVFALPWSPLHDRGAGCLHLLRDGAKLVQSVDDILEELGPLYALARHSPASVRQIDAAEPELLSHLGFEAISLDELQRVTGLSTAELLQQLSSLEIEGKVGRTAAGYLRC